MHCSSDPTSPKYGKHWSADEVHRHFSPTDETINAVKQWLVAAGFDSDRVLHTENKGWLAFEATVEEAETLLLAEYYEHEHTRSGKLKVGCDRYELLDLGWPCTLTALANV
jgi:tripeptidyl-peptidase I